MESLFTKSFVKIISNIVIITQTIEVAIIYKSKFLVKKEGLHLREMAKMPSDVKQLDSEIEDVKRNWFKLTQLSSSFKNELENSLGL